MGNYNPRQNTRMRWKDAKELEKFVFISGPFAFTSEVLEHVSKDKLYHRIIEVINGSIPVLVYDTVNFELTIGNVDSGTMYLSNLNGNQGNSYVLDYDKENDKLTIESTTETFISEDNVKTIFGQSISGTGDIGLYMHMLGLIKSKTEYADTEYKILVTYYSSNNLKVDSLQDLTALTKASSTNKVILTGIAFYNAESGNPANTIYNDYCGVQFDGTNWRFRRITDTSTPTGALITAVSDIVTPI